MDLTTRAAARFVLIFSVLVALPATGAAAQEAQTASVELTPSQNSGVRGTAILEDAGDGVEVRLSVSGLPETGVKHINHIHGGATCADDRAGRGAPATIPLKTLVAEENGTSGATTALEGVTVAGLFDTAKDRYIKVHTKAKKGEGIPPGIACADLTGLSGGADGPGVAAEERPPVEVMPDTGGPRLVYPLLVGIAVLSLLGVAAGSSPRNGDWGR